MAGGAFRDRSGRQRPAADLANPGVADGNCDSAAWAVHAAVDPDACSAHYFETWWAGRRHAALVVATTTGPLVVDVAARQFDPAAPFPLVEPVGDYRRRLG